MKVEDKFNTRRGIVIMVEEPVKEFPTGSIIEVEGKKYEVIESNRIRSCFYDDGVRRLALLTKELAG
jgi:hypothetical protein